MAEVVLQVIHEDLDDGMVEFTDDEVVEIQTRAEQLVNEQEAQGGNIRMVYIGEERHEFDIQFNHYFGSTGPKLQAIRQLRATFVIRPYVLEEPATEYTVFWPGQPTFIERWVRGRRAAQWDNDITWKESRLVSCPAVGAS